MSVSKARIHKAKVSRQTVTKKEVAIVDTPANLEDMILEYEMTNQRIKILQARMKNQLRPAIENELKARGVPDISGHRHLEYTGIDAIHERRAPLVFNEVAAEAILTKKGLLESVSHEVITRVMDEEKIMEAYEAGLISPKEFDKMYQESESWALKIKIDPTVYDEYKYLQEFRKRLEAPNEELTEMPEIEVSDG